MFKGLFQSKEDRIRVKVDEFIAEGLNHLTQKFYNGAMIEFEKAMELNPEEVYPRLVDELSNAASSGDLQSALAIGLNLIKENNEDFELANKLGNYARELGDYKQANGLYKSALKVNKSYEMAFYNLAASQAKVDIFDEAIKSALEQFDGVEGFILPDYVSDEKLVEKYTELAAENKKEEYSEKIQDLTIQREEKIEEGNAVEAKGFDLQIKKLNESMETVLPEDIIKEFKREIEEDSERAKIHKYNLAIYALHSRKTDQAIEVLNDLNIAEFDTIELLKAVAMEQRGHREDAIRKLVQLLGQNEFNRYNNVNLGLLYRKSKKRFLATKYLIKTAALLNKSNGIYSMHELIAEADESFSTGRYKKALNYYLIAASEVPTGDIWNNIGEIYVELKKYDEAVEAYRSMQKLNPKSKGADSKLREIHNYYLDRGEVLFEDRKFKPAVDYYHKALGVLRLPETIKRTADVYKQLNNSEREKELLEEWQMLVDKQKAKEQEVHRQKLIKQAKTFMAKKNYIKAIEIFEAVLRMKVDQKVFVQLAALYRGLKKTNELADLERRWEKMVLHAEKLKKYEKERLRKQRERDQEKEKQDKMV